MATQRGTESTDRMAMVSQTHSAELEVSGQVARARAEIEGQIILSRKFPRDEIINGGKIMKMCERPEFARTGFYSFPRGNTDIMGVSVKLARGMAMQWGNMTWGIRVLHDDDEMLNIEGWAWDLENNNRVSMPDSFRNLIYRSTTTKEYPVKGWVKPNERDRRELVNRRGAICMRNALLQLFPPDLVDQAFKSCLKMAQKDVTGNTKETLRNIIAAFSGLGVERVHLEDWLASDRDSEQGQAPLETIKPEELVKLRGVYSSIIDGHTKVGEHFDFRSKVADREETTTAAPGKSGTIHLGDLTAGDQAEHRPHDESMKEPEPEQPNVTGAAQPPPDGLGPATTGTTPGEALPPEETKEEEKSAEEPTLTHDYMRDCVDQWSKEMSGGSEAVAKAFIKEWGSTTSPDGKVFPCPPSLGAVTKKRMKEALYPTAKEKYAEWKTPPEDE